MKGWRSITLFLPTKILDITQFSYWHYRPRNAISVKRWAPGVLLGWFPSFHLPLIALLSKPFLGNGDGSYRSKPSETAVSHTNMWVCCGLEVKASSVLWRTLSRRKCNTKAKVSLQHRRKYLKHRFGHSHAPMQATTQSAKGWGKDPSVTDAFNIFV